ncbi:hypothetical protein ONZ43_g7852 [Nemania bipapillata]|uniref:Uncharacterized protein n=1 Tax=Nemania bipapillata TaxID=110536 RepID=A0ACC2HMV1_9PEZI|nr:hypothetical protein ONZ43_g7852 [Nemania bipapillata]
MEDAWIDDNGAAVPASSAAAAAAAGMGSAAHDPGGIFGIGGGDGDDVVIYVVDVLVRGIIMGFIWPLGSAGWLIREEGMSSERWRFMVGVGVMFGVLLGFIRAISGDK